MNIINDEYIKMYVRNSFLTGYFIFLGKGDYL